MRTNALPLRPRLRPGLVVLHRRAGEIQIGLAPRRATVVSGLPAPVAAAADHLTGDHTTEELLARVAPGHRPAMRALLAGLTDQGLVEDAARRAPPPPRLAADTSALPRAGDALGTRARSVVTVHGDGRLAASVACLLAAAGVGHVHVESRGAVAPEDIGTGLTEADVGRPRQTAVHAAIRRVDGGTATHRPTRRHPDLVLLTDALVPDPAVVQDLVDHGVPHLPVRSRDGVGIVGPFVLPGVTSCLRCADHHRADRDECWPLVAAQLAGRPLPVDLATAQTTAGLAVAQALTVLTWLHTPGDQRIPTWNTSLELDATTGAMAHRPWSPHPSCPCDAPGAPNAPAEVGAEDQEPG